MRITIYLMSLLTTAQVEECQIEAQKDVDQGITGNFRGAFNLQLKHKILFGG